MEGRVFSIVVPIELEGELVSDPILQKINVIIEYINKYRFRQRVDRDDEYQQQHLAAAISGDIKLREQIAADLAKSVNMADICSAVKNALQESYDEEELDQKAQIFNDFITEFVNHLKFIHLTAIELAVAGKSIDTLLVLLHQVQRKTQKKITEDNVHIAIINAQRRLLWVRAEIIACMQYHDKIFEKNETDKSTKDFFYSDVLINLYEEIKTISGIDLSGEREKLWPDTSYLQTMPALPFSGSSGDPETVKDFFASYINSEAPCDEDVDRLSEDIRSGLLLLDDADEPETMFVVPDEPEPASTGCFGGLSFWSRSTKVVPKVSEAIVALDDGEFSLSDEGNKSVAPKEPIKDISLDELIRLFRDISMHADEELEWLQTFDNLRKAIKDLMDQLAAEIKKLEEPSCFSFLSIFWSNTLYKKHIKMEALEYVYGAYTFAELGQRAREKMNGNNKDYVLAGWNSRTEQILSRVAYAAPAPLAPAFLLDD